MRALQKGEHQTDREVLDEILGADDGKFDDSDLPDVGTRPYEGADSKGQALARMAQEFQAMHG